jgi:hypothetical protein
MLDAYERWLRNEGYDDGTVAAQLYRVSRVEEHYGNLDIHYNSDKLSVLIDALRYSSEDERRGRPNHTLIPFDGVVRTNLASYRNAVQRYRKFCESPGMGDDLGGAVRATARKGAARPTVENPRTLADFGLDGLAPLESILAGSQYKTASQAVASLTLFSHPETVQQTGGHALFPTVRGPRQVGQFAEVAGRKIMFDDNKSATDAFLWANGISRRGRDTQFNHVYSASENPDAYTALPNLCMTPAFIAKLTDTSAGIRDLLRFRSFDLYQWIPAGVDRPERPNEYDHLEWAPPLEPIKDVRLALIEAMARKPKDRTVLAVREIGWLFGSAVV